MKKFFGLLVFSALFVGCSSDGSREFQVDEMNFDKEYDNHDISKMTKQMSIFEVVPGIHELSWKVVDELPQQKNMDLCLKLKLRLKRTVNVKPEYLKKIEDKFGPLSPFSFVLLDANGAKMDASVGLSPFSPFSMPTEETRKQLQKGDSQLFTNRDAFMDFMNFLQSKPGSEIELTMYTMGLQNNIIDCVDICKNAKGVLCLINDDDADFERNIGSIQ